MLLHNQEAVKYDRDGALDALTTQGGSEEAAHACRAFVMWMKDPENAEGVCFVCLFVLFWECFKCINNNDPSCNSRDSLLVMEDEIRTMKKRQA